MKHVATGRWEITGGWWIQPDCNLPSGNGLRKQIEIGKSYFESRFGQFPRTAYNVDSFGHAAALPRLLSKIGRASCRDRVCQYVWISVVAVSLKIKRVVDTRKKQYI